MYLKRLELQGFKSFPEKIGLDFNQGITAVVGPNGSGKSNISDAIMWVLGEQSAKNLRGSKMEDVIFAGTQNRHAVGFAEVSVILDNTDAKIPINFSEITVTRRIYRSGESEFKINGTLCRLKDVRELFMDTGIGKEGYSIISQGRIDEILSNKSEDRRLLFEEAAGIAKYKSRRNEANIKLEKERQNLIRLNDIISEIEVKIEPLKRESKRAKLFLEYKERLKLIQISIFLMEASNFKKIISKLDEDISNLNIQIDEINSKQLSTNEEINSLNDELVDIASQLELKNEQLSNNRLKNEQFENNIKLLKEQLLGINENIFRLNNETNNNKEILKNLKTFLKQEQLKKESVSHELETKQNILKDIETDFNKLNMKMSDAEKYIEQLNSSIIEKIQITTDVKGDISRIKTVQKQLNERIEQIEIDKNLINTSIIEAKDKKLYLENGIEEINKVVNNLDLEKEDLNIKTQALLDEKLTKVKQLNDLNNKLNESNSRYKLLNELKDNFEGYYRPVKAILKQKKDLQSKFGKGICGAVGNLITVSKEYENAIEVALGNSIQYIVTVDEYYAKQAIEYLKNTKEGRATFLPLTTVKPKNSLSNQADILRNVGTIGVANKLIKYSIEYDNIFSSLLGRVIVVNSMTNALKINKKYNYAFKIVTLSGEVLNTGGSITGGSKQEKLLNIFGQNREIIELQKNINNITLLKNELEKSLIDLENCIYDNEQLVIKNNELRQQKSLELVSLSQSINLVNEEISKMVEKLKNLVIEYEQNIEQKNFINEEYESNKDELATIELGIGKIKGNLYDYQQSIINNKNEREEKIRIITEYKVDISGLVQNLKEIDNNINRTIKEVKTIEQIITDSKNTINQKQQEVLEKENEVLQIENKIIENQKIHDDIESKLFYYNSLKLEVMKNLKLKEGNQKEYTKANLDLSNEFIRLKMKKEQNEIENNRLYSLMWDEYNITYQRALEYKQLDMSVQNLKKEEREIKSHIDKLGAVNINSIQEYKDTKKRYDFLIQQQDDIIKSEEKLKVIIKELTELMCKQFKDQFEVISSNFSKVFVKMFGGGDANLILSDKDNVLESYIEIVAQPLGKKLTGISLLSGGERSLTAISLLFAILIMKPSPFCILDEVEAALDDANVNRYSNFIKKFSSDTQFILITHRKGTMECADILYGITMQEKGVSKLVSVKFIDDIV